MSFTDDQLLNLVNNLAKREGYDINSFTGGCVQIATAYNHKIVNHKVMLFFGYDKNNHPVTLTKEIHADLFDIWSKAIQLKVYSIKTSTKADHISELNELMNCNSQKEKRTKKEKEVEGNKVEGRGIGRGRVSAIDSAIVSANNSLPDWLDKKIWNEWVEYRKEIRKKITPSVQSKQIKFLEKHKDKHKEIIEQSIRNGWTGLFELKNEDRGNGHKPESIKELKAYLKQFAAEGKNLGWSTMFEGREVKIDNSGRPYDAETIDDLDYDKAGRFYAWLIKNLESLEGKK